MTKPSLGQEKLKGSWGKYSHKCMVNTSFIIILSLATKLFYTCEKIGFEVKHVY